ncbi:toxin co-regulated pilus biosynthesis Q family protein [Neptunicella sp. SCSIO 80796]|uniref:toxin co-regulated pilus biosynthesis Q family protein n=1 Tax=Neptunicella plasticusilytica TaxID=3117012 RepID=UPI003A4D6816
MNSSSEFKFWIKHIGLAVILIVIAVLVLVLKNYNSNKPVAEGKPASRDPAQNMSRVYSQHRMSSIEPIKEDKGDFVLDVNTPDADIQDRLKKMESLLKPVSGRWVGEHKYRTFKAGSTLREAITDYAQKEGMQVLWELDQDFIIKNHFQMENTIVGSLLKISKAIDASFDGKVLAYFCPKQRTLVITEKQTPYLTNTCSLAKG